MDLQTCWASSTSTQALRLEKMRLILWSCRKGGPAGKYYLSCPICTLLPALTAAPSWQLPTTLYSSRHISLPELLPTNGPSTPLRVLLSVTGKLLVHITEIKQVGIIICSSSPLLCNSQASNVGLGFKCIWSGTYFLVLISNNVMLKTIPAMPLFVS